MAAVKTSNDPTCNFGPTFVVFNLTTQVGINSTSRTQQVLNISGEIFYDDQIRGHTECETSHLMFFTSPFNLKYKAELNWIYPSLPSDQQAAVVGRAPVLHAARHRGRGGRGGPRRQDDGHLHQEPQPQVRKRTDLRFLVMNRLGICDFYRFVWIMLQICVFLLTVGGESANLHPDSRKPSVKTQKSQVLSPWSCH